MKVTDLTVPMNFLKVIQKAGGFLVTFPGSVSVGSGPAQPGPQVLNTGDWLWKALQQMPLASGLLAN